MVELLKQGQYAPYDVIDQCISIFAGSKGFLDDVDPNRVHEFESGLLEYFRGPAKGLRDELVSKRSFKEIGDQIETAISEFKAGFVAAN